MIDFDKSVLMKSSLNGGHIYTIPEELVLEHLARLKSHEATMKLQVESVFLGSLLLRIFFNKVCKSPNPG